MTRLKKINLKNRFLIVTLLTIMVISMYVFALVKVSASTETKVTLIHDIDEALETNKTYTLNGLRYTYLYNERFSATVAENPESIKRIIFYEKINGKDVTYPTDLNLNAYTSLEDVIVFDTSKIGNIFAGKIIKNLYMANQNNVKSEFANFEVINYHFVSPYKALYTDITFLSLNDFNGMNITNAYYYSWNEHFFKDLADKYHATTEAKHNFLLKNEIECAYTKESFYPFKGYKPFIERSGIKYYQGSGSLKFPDNPTNENIDYIPYLIDPRVRSFTTPKLSSINLFGEPNFDTVDIRRYSLTGVDVIKADTIILSNASNIFDTLYINCKNVYFVYDPDGKEITEVKTSYVKLDNIFIPTEHKEHFTTIINNIDLEDKIIYYSGEIKTDFKFTNDENTVTYKSNDDFVDIDTVLEGVEILEKSGILISEDCYINEFLEKYSLPLNKETKEAAKYDLARFFVFTKYIDIKKAVEEMKPYILYKDNKPTPEKYDLVINLKENKVLELIGKYPDGLEFEYLVDYKIIDSNVGEFLGCDRLGEGTFTLMVEAKTIKEGTNAKDLMLIYLEYARDFKTMPEFLFPITLTKEGVSTVEISRYKNIEDIELIATGQVVVTKNDLNPDGFNDPFYTTKDEYGKATILDVINYKLRSNSALKWVSISISSVLGVILFYFIFVLMKKGFKWLKK